MYRKNLPVSRRTTALIAVILLFIGAVTAHGYVSTYDREPVRDEHSNYEQDYSGQDSTRAEQYVYTEDGEVYVERSQSGDGVVEQHVEQTDDGVITSQRLHESNTYTHSSETGTDRTKKKNKYGHQYRDMEQYGGDRNNITDNGVDDEFMDNQTGGTDENVSDNETGDNVSEDNETEVGNNDTETGMNETVGNETDGETIPPVEDIVNNDTDDNGARNSTGDNETEIGGNGASDSIVDITPRSGSRILGDSYQTPPAEKTEPPVTQRRGLLARIIAFFQDLIRGILNWFARIGTL